MFFTKLPLLIATSLFSLAVGGPSPATATADRDGSKARPNAAAKRGDAADRGGEGLCARIGCTDAQRTELATIRTETREQLRGVRGEGDELRAALAKAMRDDDLTASEAKAALATRDDAEAARRDIMAGALVRVHDALDPKQREQLAAIVQKHGHRAILGGGHHGKAKAGKAKAGKAKAGKAKAEGRGRAGGERRKAGKPGQSAKR